MGINHVHILVILPDDEAPLPILLDESLELTLLAFSKTCRSVITFPEVVFIISSNEKTIRRNSVASSFAAVSFTRTNKTMVIQQATNLCLLWITPWMSCVNTRHQHLTGVKNHWQFTLYEIRTNLVNRGQIIEFWYCWYLRPIVSYCLFIPEFLWSRDL